MTQISFSEDEYSLLNSSLCMNLNRVEQNKYEFVDLYDKYEQIESDILKTLSLMNDSTQRKNSIITLESNDILNISEALIYRLEELNNLIDISNNTCLREAYEKRKNSIMSLHEKIVLSGYNKK